ncbi:hypothetical protein F5Y07DRAFT_45969 [Xylaria sp. FL0933]|nr:hypothetical protein F5Y07DRAFT_45969 [Xylaria sp. FL0933]
MSIELNWETLTGGPEGNALAERIRDFIHVKFQAVPLPRFIKSVAVHEFAFGNIPPSIVLKDICDPLPDFYEEDYDSQDEDDAEGDEDDDEGVPDAIRTAERRRRAEQRAREGGEAGHDVAGKAPPGASGTATPFGEGFFPPHVHSAGLRNAPGAPDLSTPLFGLGVSSHGMPGGPSKMHYFQSKLGPGWSGTQTPLAAVAGAQHLNGWLDATAHSQGPSSHHYISRSNSGHSRHLSQGSISVENYPNSLAVPARTLREKHSVSTLSPTPSAGASRPPTRDRHPGASPLVGSASIDGDYGSAAAQAYARSKATVAVEDEDDEGGEEEGPNAAGKFIQEPRPDDMQAVFRIHYAGDVRLELTAMILLDYPMPSFVGIPLKLNITGLTFDGVGVIAYIRKRVHFCFLSPEDAVAAVGEDDDEGGGGGEDEATPGRPHPSGASHQARGSEDRSYNSPGPKGKGRVGGLLQEIRVESEIGQREGSKQSLKNVGKVEKFVLEQVRRIFEEEFVYPSFWTFLV